MNKFIKSDLEKTKEDWRKTKYYGEDTIKKLKARFSFYTETGLVAELTLFWLIGALVIWLIPKIDPSTQGPGIVTAIGVGLVLIWLTTRVVYFGINTSLKLTKKVLLFTFLYNALIIIAKFTISPLSVYEANRSKLFSFNINDNFFAFAVITVFIFLLYFIVFSVVYLYFKRKVKKSIQSKVVTRVKKAKRYKFLIFFGLTVLIGAIAHMINDEIWVYPFFYSIVSLEYLSFVFSGIFSVIIALILVGAIGFVVAAFKSATDQAILLRSVAILSSFFWIGAVFLFIYHTLWVVYLLVLTALWPLSYTTPE